jgi:molybdenum cofactor cytidylyltransferase
VLLAAGESRRMGRPKGLLPWAGKPLLRHQVDVLRGSSVSDIAVILGEGVDDLAPLIPDDDRVRTIWNARHASGRSSSAIIGTVALNSRDALMFCNVDQPLSARLVDDFLRGASMDSDLPVAVATQRGRRGHPILIRRALFSEVISISESSEGLKAVIRRDPARVLSVPTDSPNAHVGFNRLDEYEHAVQRLRRGELEAG